MIKFFNFSWTLVWIWFWLVSLPNRSIVELVVFPQCIWCSDTCTSRSISPPNRTEIISKELAPNSLCPLLLQASAQPPPAEKEATSEEKRQPILPAEEDVAAAACISQEWEELIVTEVAKSYSPTCISKPTVKNSVSSLPDNKPLDEKTYRILERLEAPRQKKTKVTLPVLTVNNFAQNASVPVKKPLAPFASNNLTDHQLSSSQPIKPSFQRVKRRFRWKRLVRLGRIISWPSGTSMFAETQWVMHVCHVYSPYVPWKYMLWIELLKWTKSIIRVHVYMLINDRKKMIPRKSSTTFLDGERFQFGA